MSDGLDSLFTLIDPPTVGSDNAVTRVRIDADHPLFRGHFPERSVLPGVVMAHIAVCLISTMVGAPMRIVSARAIKFLSPVDPHLTPELTYHTVLRDAEDGRSADVRVTAGNVVVMKLTASVIRDER